MSAEATLATVLGAVAAITDIVGTAIGLASNLPENAPDAPAVTWQRITTLAASQDLTDGGDIDDVRMQIDCWGQTAVQAKALATAIRNTLTPNGAQPIARFDGGAGPYLDADNRTWRVRQDFFIWEERS
jgi:Flp pilus assembly protein CpaB